MKIVLYDLCCDFVGAVYRQTDMIDSFFVFFECLLFYFNCRISNSKIDYGIMLEKAWINYFSIKSILVAIKFFAAFGKRDFHKIDMVNGAPCYSNCNECAINVKITTEGIICILDHTWK